MTNTKKSDPLYKIFNPSCDQDRLQIAEKIQQRRLQMIVHSCLYYCLDNSIISDSQWATWGKELAKLQELYPRIAEVVPYAEYFEDWDASTGFNLPINESWVIQKAYRLLQIGG